MNDKVRFVKESPEVYQLECGIKIIFDPYFNVWKVEDNKNSTWEKILIEVVGKSNSDIPFEFSRLVIKEEKYGLTEDEFKKLNELKDKYGKIY